ncbi:MAG: putative ATP-grasp enzyme-like protein [Frankiales bacterium]|nr:putative ATP-grasp enzyme-like protein [Frankiales bacterium]
MRHTAVGLPETYSAPVLALAGQQVLAEGLPASPAAALVMNTHITGLAVTRSLGRAGVPVVGLDDERGGLGQHSRHLAGLGLVPGPDVDDGRALADHLVALGPSFAERPVLMPTNDDWVLALARHRDRLEEHYRFPFAPYDVVQRALGKTALYRACEALGVDVPRTWYLDDASPQDVAAQVDYPCVLKPDDSRGFYRAFRAKVFVVEDAAAFVARCAEAAAHGLTLVAQRWVATGPGGFWSVASYLSPDGTPRGVFTGRKLEQWPPDFGTSCLADAQWRPEIAAAGVSVLQALGYHGISEIEFVQDSSSGRLLLLDVNTRAWKWVGLPVAAGVDLPLLAYRDAVGEPFDSGHQRDGTRWTFLRDYLPLVRAGAATVPEAQVTKAEWTALLAGTPSELVDAVHDPDDPEPGYDVLWDGLTGGLGYRCAC